MPAPQTARNSETAPAAGGAAPERRGVTRFAMGALPGCQVLYGEPPAPAGARLADLSACGAGLVLSCPLPAESVVAVHLAPGPFLSARSAAARVAYCVALSEGTYLAGVAFARRLTPDELRVLLS